MNYCINPLCAQRQNPDSAEVCIACGNPLLINQRIRLKKPLRPLDLPSNTEIFEVEDLGTKWHPVKEIRVMKVLKWAEPKLVELIERESRALALIDNPNIPRSIPADDFFVFSPENTPLKLKLYCLIMDKIPGQDLEAWIEENGSISQNLAHTWLKQMLEILDITHRSTFFHRDIKPANIIVQPNNQLALIDFGAVQQITDDYLLKASVNGGTPTGIGIQYKNLAIGTPGYAPSEQMDGRALPQSDFYALGRTFVRLLTGKHLFELKTNPKTGKLIWRNKAPQIDNTMADFIDHLMTPFVGDRPQHAQLALQRLNRLPLQSKINQVIKSKPFRIGALILSFLAIFTTYNGSKPILANYFFHQGKKAETENRFAEAKKNFNLAIHFNKNINQSISSFYFEKAFRNSSRPSIAKKYYEHAIKFNRKDIAVYSNLALVCQQLLDFQCVNNSYSHALKLNSNDWIIHYNLGNFYDDQEEYDKATQQYYLAITKSNNTAIGPINNLSRLNNKNGNYKKAESFARQGLKIHKTDNKNIQAPLYKNLGWSLLGQQSYQKAHDYLQKASELDSQQADTYCLLAQTQEKLNLPSDAKLSWELCLILNSTLPEVRTWRQKMLRRLLQE